MQLLLMSMIYRSCCLSWPGQYHAIFAINQFWVISPWRAGGLANSNSKFIGNTRARTPPLSWRHLGALLSSPIIYSADRKIKKMYSAVRWSKAECLSAQVFRTRRHFAFKLKLINASYAAQQQSLSIYAYMYVCMYIAIAIAVASSWHRCHPLCSDRAAVWKLQMRQLHMYAMALFLFRFLILPRIAVLHFVHLGK